jgi:hypothetical protein
MVTLVTPAAPYSTVGTEIHQGWCNSKSEHQTYVKETLQPPPNVLPSGPFKKVFSASHGTGLFRCLRVISEAHHRHSGSRKLQSDERLVPFATREPLPEFIR